MYCEKTKPLNRAPAAGSYGNLECLWLFACLSQSFPWRILQTEDLQASCCHLTFGIVTHVFKWVSVRILERLWNRLYLTWFLVVILVLRHLRRPVRLYLVFLASELFPFLTFLFVTQFPEKIRNLLLVKSQDLFPQTSMDELWQRSAWTYFSHDLLCCQALFPPN